MEGEFDQNEVVSLCMTVTSPFLARSIQANFRMRAVRKGTIHTTRNSCYLVRKPQHLHKERVIFNKKLREKNCDIYIKSHIILFYKVCMHIT